MTAPALTPPEPPRPALPLLELQLSGVLDVSTLLRVSEQLDEGLSLHPSRFVVDLSRCAWVDPQALRVLADAAQAARAQGTRLQLRGLSGQALEMLQLVGVLAA